MKREREGGGKRGQRAAGGRGGSSWSEGGGGAERVVGEGEGAKETRWREGLERRGREGEVKEGMGEAEWCV